MAAVLRSLGTVMAIQIRARVQRLQMADETRKTSKDLALDNQCRNGFRKDTSENIHDRRGALMSKSTHINHTLAGRVERGFARRSLRWYPAWSKSEYRKTPFDDPPLQQLSDFIPTDSQFVPNYMSNTKSLEAKSRSHSKLKQRPKWEKKPKSSRRGSSMDGKNDKDNLYPWLIKLYGSDKFRNERDCDSISTMTSNSNHRRLLITFEIMLSFLFILMSFITLEASDFIHLTASCEFVLILHDQVWNVTGDQDDEDGD
ncbi:unnamed protein product [Fraxinus pennsylvanica]|uniref:DUF4005 domain-containing protein n=1 Tax=Fraxinus pennsylvanica TaxID=56036 RepID=A0AAD1Z5C9_9LAMI|nr:unnamed protein product [Fraxinus pennsylvanica]